MIQLYTDAAVNGDPGQAGVGLLVVTENNQFQLTKALAGQWNNHQAEFQALLSGLSWLVENNHHHEMTFCYADSQIVAQSIEKEYVKDITFQKYLTEILELMEYFPYISVAWIPQSENRGADNLARQALQKALKNSD